MKRGRTERERFNHDRALLNLSLCNTWTNHMAVTTGDEQSRGYWLAPKTLLSNPCLFQASIPLSPPPSPDALHRQSAWVIGRKPNLLSFSHCQLPRSLPLSEWLDLTWCKIKRSTFSRFLSFLKNMLMLFAYIKLTAITAFWAVARVLLCTVVSFLHWFAVSMEVTRR